MGEFFQKNKYSVIFLSIFIAFIFYTSNTFSILFVSGSSMNPTFQDRDIIVLKKERNLIKNQIVIFEPPNNWKEENDITQNKFVKRIVAVSGDEVKIQNGDVYVNGKIHAEDAAFYCEENYEFTVPERRYFLMGDNYGKSNDSLMQLCKGNLDYLVRKSSIIVNGHESFRIGANNNE